MPVLFRGIALLLCASATLLAGDLAVPTVAKFIRVIASASGASKVACSDREVAGELASLGVQADPEAKVVWAGSERDAGRFAKLGRVVICGNIDWLNAGATIAIVAEGGRPALYISARNLAATGVAFPDTIMKISKVIK
jgi:hypothetical protein